MFMLTITPARNVIVSRHCVKSESRDLFFNKVVREGEKIQVYDVAERKAKLLDISEINTIKHRMIVNNKRFFICKLMAC